MTIGSFEHELPAQRVVFGAGRARTSLVDEVERLGARRVLMVVAPSSAELATELAAELAKRLPVAGWFRDVVQHVPVAVAEAARAVATEVDADLVVALGGGSAVGTAKAVALTTGLPVLAVPTTYAGSEATAVWGLTEDGRKITGTDPAVLPRTIVYDPDLTMTLPVGLAVASGLNAMAHCVDSLWATRANPILGALAGEGIRALAPALRGVVRDGSDPAARAGCLYGAYVSATAFAGAGSALHHKICHVLGGTLDLPHAQTHAVVLPHVLAFNAPAAPAAAARIAVALGAAGSGPADAVAALTALYADLDAPRSLRALGMAEADIDRVVDRVVAAAPGDNPRPVTADGVRALLLRAWAGEAAGGSRGPTGGRVDEW